MVHQPNARPDTAARFAKPTTVVPDTEQMPGVRLVKVTGWSSELALAPTVPEQPTQMRDAASNSMVCGRGPLMIGCAAELAYPSPQQNTRPSETRAQAMAPPAETAVAGPGSPTTSTGMDEPPGPQNGAPPLPSAPL
jgi:hypothetical protein